MATIQNKLFGYPVLAYDNDNYVNVDFQSESTRTLEKNKNTSKLQYIFEVSDDYIQYLIRNNIAKPILKVYCSSTKFRKIYDLSFGLNDIILNNKDVNNRVELSSYIILNEYINNYYSSNFNTDYQNERFDLEKGSIIAIGKQETVFIEKDIYEFTKISSVIKVRRSENDDKEMSVEYSGPNIYVYLNSADYDIYSQYAKACLEVANSMVILPAITFVLDQISKNEESFSEYEELKWFRVIKKKIAEKYNKEFTASFIDAVGSIIIAQQILEYPLTPGFEWLRDKID